MNQVQTSHFLLFTACKFFFLSLKYSLIKKNILFLDYKAIIICACTGIAVLHYICKWWSNSINHFVCPSVRQSVRNAMAKKFWFSGCYSRKTTDLLKLYPFLKSIHHTTLPVDLTVMLQKANIYFWKVSWFLIVLYSHIFALFLIFLTNLSITYFIHLSIKDFFVFRCLILWMVSSLFF